MTDQIKERLKNPALRLAEEIAAARLKRAGVKLGDDWGLRPVKAHAEEAFPPELIRKIAGG
jgi:hypothetical protein